MSKGNLQPEELIALSAAAQIQAVAMQADLRKFGHLTQDHKTEIYIALIKELIARGVLSPDILDAEPPDEDIGNFRPSF